MIVVGTSAVVAPASGYIEKARRRGAVVVNVNPTADSPEELEKLGPGDFAFAEDAAVCLPKLLAPLIGELDKKDAAT